MFVSIFLAVNVFVVADVSLAKKVFHKITMISRFLVVTSVAVAKSVTEYLFVPSGFFTITFLIFITISDCAAVISIVFDCVFNGFYDFQH